MVTRKLPDLVNVDLLSDGSVYGIELPDAARQLMGADNSFLRVLSEFTSQETEIKLAG